MPEISRFFGIVIAMYWVEHGPPHFHARYGGYKVTIAIDSLTVLEGSFPPRVLGFVVEWASQHQKELAGNWEKARLNRALKKIAPLQ